MAFMGSVPDRTYPERAPCDDGLRPSWQANPGFVNPGHASIFEETKDIPGWQMPGDSYKLYEMGFFAGDAILEIGTFGGRSAVVELKGALSNPARKTKPQFFGVDILHESIVRTFNSLKAHGVDEFALLYCGSLRAFAADVPVNPTMVFVDGDHAYEGVKDDTEVLSDLLRANVPVLFHDFLNSENDTGAYGVRRAASEWESDGFVTFQGAFGCSGLFLTTNKCRGRNPFMSEQQFRTYRGKYFQPAETPAERPVATRFVDRCLLRERYRAAGINPPRFSRRLAETIARAGPAGRLVTDTAVRIKHRLLG
jgi:hypothetical protein